jgi:hypothetical protein
MTQIKGHVLLSRFDYLEFKMGEKVLKEFLKKFSTEDQNFARQPVNGANYYAEHTLAAIDDILLKDYFNKDIEEFLVLGEWNANNFMRRYFSLYTDEKKPIEFLEQYTRLREVLIGSGEMVVVLKNENKLKIVINYGQRIPKSVCLSEQGFILGGLRLCGAQNAEMEEEVCAASSDSFACKFKIRLSKKNG